YLFFGARRRPFYLNIILIVNNICLFICSGDCYRITPGIMAGIIAVDMFLTVLLLIPVYCILGKLVPSSSPCEKRGRQKAEIVSGEKCEMQMLWVQGIKET
uniref:Uncharacterized protein n=1 Tax=Varanus komodoensis TaxID=61221 RepID=A0A8D2JG49_VARKO